MKWNAARAKRKLDKLWAEIVRRRDGHCTFCWRSDCKLDANHIMSRRHTATRWDLRNGNALCFTCHRRFHDDPPWGIAMTKVLISEELYTELFTLAHRIKPFDRAAYATTLVELEKRLHETA